MSARLLGIAIVALLAAGVAALIVKGPEDKGTAEPAPTATFTFPGPIPTQSSVIPTDFPTSPEPTATEPGATEPAPTGTEPGATEPAPTDTEVEPTESPDLPRTGQGSLAQPALLTLLLAIASGLAVRRSAYANR